MELEEMPVTQEWLEHQDKEENLDDQESKGRLERQECEESLE